MDDKRKRKLHWFFKQIIEGKEQIQTPERARRFIESLCHENDPVTCISNILTSSHGIIALQQSTHIDITLTFVNNSGSQLLEYIRRPEIAIACGGELLRKVLRYLTEPSLFWDALCRHAENHALTSASLQSFAWTLLQLLSAIDSDVSKFVQLASRESIQKILHKADQPETRNVYQKIKHVIATLDQSTPNLVGGPGGRHNNDFEDFRQIALLPTVDELVCVEKPFLRFASEIEDVDEQKRLASHLDNQFRLLREDMLRDLKDDVKGQGKARGHKIDGLRLRGIEHNDRSHWALAFECTNGLRFLPKGTVAVRKHFLLSHRKVLSAGSLGCIIADGVIVGLGLVWRREDQLAEQIPILHLHLPNNEIAVRHTLRALRGASQIQIIQLNTAIFAYEPVLQQLQNARQLPLAERLLNWRPEEDAICIEPTQSLQCLVDLVKQTPSTELQSLLSLPQSTKLDINQAQSLVVGLSHHVALIQGPPGTGKSFIGALVAKAIHKYTDSKILVLSYTNHALDQYLEDLIKVGIPTNDVVRLGSPSKASSATKSLVLQEQLSSNPQYNSTRAQWDFKDTCDASARSAATNLAKSFGEYMQNLTLKKDVMDYLEFSMEFDEFFEAFQIPDQSDFQVVDRSGKAIEDVYLFDRWCRGKGAGVFKDHSAKFPKVWLMSSDERESVKRRWFDDILGERLGRIAEYGSQYNKHIEDIKAFFNERGQRLMRDRRIVGCTTTAAAKYVKDIQSMQPNIIIVEEAGEILESHILAALGASTKQLILIGDHKQLRPKVHYALSVEKGEGYDLNRSLFERLVLKNYPHVALSQQHRMRPEISALVRGLTYPELTDAESTNNRSPMRGFQDNIVFVNHNIPETEGSDIYDPRDGGRSSSKTNDFEAHMTLKCVKYLAQQGYNSDQVVVLTPYLGQLRLLYDVLQAENDPVLNDMDSHDLVRAGLTPQATALLGRRKLRVSTIDNYQGEESDIIIASLTRSNDRFDIGFLASPERLNVLISRARDGLILIGNAEMFIHARKGKELWIRFMDLLRKGSHIYNGFPIRCERHPDRKSVVPAPEDFDKLCPDGGCDAPCNKILNCNIHFCPQKCHQIYDHSKIKCGSIVTDKCSVGHKLSWPCHNGRPEVCRECNNIKRREDKKRKQEHERLVQEAMARQEHEERMSDLDSQIAQTRQQMSDLSITEDRRLAHQQKLQDLQSAQKAFASAKDHKLSKHDSMPEIEKSDSMPQNEKGDWMPETQTADSTHDSIPSITKAGSLSIPPLTPSSAALEWKRMKDLEGTSNDAIEELMKLTGLEVVKRQFLDVLQKLQTAQRQGTDLKQERLGTVLLGNPGTGKTTVARLYAKFLASVEAIPGSTFVETTGAKLANEGVNGARKMLDNVIQAGGGAIFIDEAYQLVSGNNYGGSAVLDFLLAEIENSVGKVVFMFAGYEKQMEKFFQHNPGLPSRMPVQLKFADYSEVELMHMLSQKIHKKYKGRMKIEEGYDGLYMRIVIRRLHRLSGIEGFGNARALENVLARMTSAQSRRINSERRKGTLPDDFLLTKEDLIGPEPSGVLQQSEAWKKLQKLPGLKSVKAAVQVFLIRVSENYQRELKEQKILEVSLNRMFLGPPGTGKTTVAKLYGQILAEIGLLSTSECVVKTPADFIGSAMGESEKNTKSILENTKGKVLLIDEAYMLGSAFSSSTSGSDPYRTAVIDTIVSEVHSAPGDDRAVLLLGYREQMEDMLRKVNPGLARRFPIENAFIFEDYNDDELLSILNYKLQDQGLEASDTAKTTAIDVLGKLRRRPNFGNAGEIENLLSRAKDNFSKRQQVLPPDQRLNEILFGPEDIDPDFGRSDNAAENCVSLFKDVVGSEHVMNKLLGYIEMFNNAQEMELDPLEIIPFNFVFKGPPGTGKTTTARKIGKVFYDMGFLASDNVVECSATDLIGEYVGQTGPKVVKKFDESLGQILFIDEAYRLGEGPYAKEAIDEIVDCLTKPRYKGKMLVVLAGYEGEINRLLSFNPGLSSRFPEEFMFSDLSPSMCVDLLTKKLRANKKLSVELDQADDSKVQAENLFTHLTKLSGWGNGRDIETLSSRIVGNILRTQKAQDGKMIVTWANVLPQLTQLHLERIKRTTTIPDLSKSNPLHQLQMKSQQDQPPSVNTISSFNSTQQGEPQAEESTQSEAPTSLSCQVRDADVSDAIWAQLQIDRIRGEQEEAELATSIQESHQEHDDLARKAAEITTQVQNLDNQKLIDEEALRRREKLRLEAIAFRQKAAEEAARLRKLQEEKAQKQKAQQKLMQMGACPAGFQWIKQSGGYRCAGGSHWVENASLGM